MLLSLAWSAALFALDQELLARANRRAGVIDDTIRGRPPKTFSPLNRQWVIGRDGSIYHYGFFDPRNDRLSLLTVYRLIPGEWNLRPKPLPRPLSTAAPGWDCADGRRSFPGQAQVRRIGENSSNRS